MHEGMVAHSENRNCFRHLKKTEGVRWGCSGTAALTCMEFIEGDIYLYNTEYPLRNDNCMIQSNNYGIYRTVGADKSPTAYPSSQRSPLMLQLCLSAGLVIIISALSSILEAALYSLPISHIEITSRNHSRIRPIFISLKKNN